MKDTYAGASYDKSVARERFWKEASAVLGSRFATGKHVFLASREGGDVGVLLEQHNLPPKSLIPIEIVPDAARKCQLRWPSTRVRVGDIQEILEKERIDDVATCFLDLCGPASYRSIGLIRQVARTLHSNNDIFLLGVSLMSGRGLHSVHDLSKNYEVSEAPAEADACEKRAFLIEAVTARAIPGTPTQRVICIYYKGFRTYHVIVGLLIGKQQRKQQQQETSNMAQFDYKKANWIEAAERAVAAAEAEGYWARAHTNNGKRVIEHAKKYLSNEVLGLRAEQAVASGGEMILQAVKSIKKMPKSDYILMRGVLSILRQLVSTGKFSQINTALSTRGKKRNSPTQAAPKTGGILREILRGLLRDELRTLLQE